MRIIRGLHNLGSFRSELAAGCVATLGAFDGLHLGHKAVLDQLIEEAAKRDCPAVVVVLEPLPREYFAPVQAPARLMSLREKAEGFHALGVDFLLVIRFNEQLRNMSAEVFIERVFIDGLNVAHLIMGDDSHFGRGGEGDVDLLRRYGEQHNFKVVPTRTCSVDGERVSSSRIRELLEAGELGKAERLLGRPYTISGKVIYGRQLGRTLGAPTANIALHRLRAAMAGVYAVEARVYRQDALLADRDSEQWYAAVANVGTRPTVNESIEAMLEVHLLAFAGDLYGARLEIRFLQWLREERRFESLDLLKQQIQRDIMAAKAWFASRELSA